MLTNEQNEIVETVLEGDRDRIVAVNAVAGSGKTATAKAICEAVRPAKGFYTAFNKGIVADSKKRLGKLVDARTIHSLAYRHVNPSKPVQELTFTDITDDLSYSNKQIVIKNLDKFYRSAYTCLEDFLDNEYGCPTYLQDYIIKYAEKMYNGEINCTFNYLLKCLHLLLYNGDLELRYDLFILDECQDTSPVILEIFKLIECNHKVMLGDTHQNIYEFLDTVNGFKLIDNTIDLSLTKSFRCCPSVSEQVQDFGRKNLSESFIFSGNEELDNSTTGTEVYLSRTNSRLIAKMCDLISEGKTFSLIRDVNSIFALPIAIIMASAGKPIYDRQYKYLEGEYIKWSRYGVPKNFLTHLLILDIEEVKIAINVLTYLNSRGVNIFKLKEKVKSMKPNPNIVLSTAHAFKGLEMSTAYIDSELTLSTYDINKPTEQDLNLYYVALSRAQNKLEYGW